MSTPTPMLIQRLDTFDSSAGAAELRAHSYDLLRLRPGAAVVDVGCGTGRAVAELAELGAAAIGVEPNQQMLDVARARWAASDFREGTAEALPLLDTSVSGYRADKVLHVLTDPTAALAEAKRVLMPGGRIVLLGQDWEAFVIDSDDPDSTRTIVRARADKVANPRVARAHRNLLLDSGFQDVTVEVRTPVFTDELMLPMLNDMVTAAIDADALPRDRAEAWLAEQTARAGANRLMVALPLFIAAATRAD